MSRKRRVKLEFVGPIRRPWREQSREIEISEGVTINELLEELGYAENEREHLSILLNAEKAIPATQLHNGDQIVVTVIVGGG